jgi:hypothetical protein
LWYISQDKVWNFVSSRILNLCKKKEHFEFPELTTIVLLLTPLGGDEESLGLNSLGNKCIILSHVSD